MNIISLFYLSFAVFVFLIATLVLIRKSKSAINISFSFLCFALAIWFFGFANMFSAANSSIALIWAKIGFIGIAFTAVLILRFIYAYSRTVISNKVFIFFCFLSTIAIIINFHTDLFYKGIESHFFGFYPKAGLLYILIPLQLIIVLALSLKHIKISLRQRDLTAFRHHQIIKIQNALIIFLLILIDHFLTFVQVPVYPFGALSAFISIAIIVYALGRYNFSDIKILLSKTFIIIFLIGFILGSSYFIWHFTDSWIISTIFTFIIAVAGTHFYRAAKDKTSDLFLAEQKKYHNMLIQAASGMAREHELDRFLKIISIIVIKYVKVENIAIFIENESGKLFECRHIRPHYPDEMLFPYSIMHPFITFMKQRGSPFVIADLPLYITNSIGLPFKPDLVVPFFFDEGAKGFIVTGKKKNKKSFNREDLNVFKNLSRQTSLAIENCIFFEEFKHTQEKIFTAEKLASIGGLADGVAHQINNRLNQFSMISGDLKYGILDYMDLNKDLIDSNESLKKAFEEIISHSESLAENIKRTDAVIKGILSYAREGKKGDMFSEFALQEVIDLSMELLKLKHKLHKDFVLDFKFATEDKVYGIRSQIIESVYNVLDNAYEATLEKLDSLKDAEKENYKPIIQIRLKHLNDKAVFSIQDNGIGIKDENKIKLFAPFFTTKSSYKSGTGIGLYIVKRMIEENHEGRLTFESKYGQGTKIIFELPLKADYL